MSFALLVAWFKTVFETKRQKKARELKEIRREMSEVTGEVTLIFQEIQYHHARHHGDEVEGLREKANEAAAYKQAIDEHMDRAYPQLIAPYTEWINTRPWVKALFIDPKFFQINLPYHALVKTLRTKPASPSHSDTSAWIEKVENDQKLILGGKTINEYTDEIRDHLESLKDKEVILKDVIADTFRVAKTPRPFHGEIDESHTNFILETLRPPLDAGEQTLAQSMMAQFLSGQIHQIYHLLFMANFRHNALLEAITKLLGLLEVIQTEQNQITREFGSRGVNAQDLLTVRKFSKIDKLRKRVQRIRHP